MNGKTQRSLLVVATLTGFGLLVACNPPASDQHLQEQAAQATEQAKQGSKQALADARVAAANAERAVNDVAAGVKQGINTKTPAAAGGARLDLNSASQGDLASLPGISADKASQIIDHRPYTASHDLVKAGILTEHQFENIAGQVTVH